jgi:RNA polymerase sigma-70 factor, ECF subfamily
MNEMESIWKEYYEPLQGFIGKRVSDASAVEDILQEVFLKIYDKFYTLRDSRRIRNWIYRITRNAIIDYYRGRRPTGELPETIAYSEMGESEKAQQEIAKCIVPMIERLPDHYRQAVMLSEIQGLKQRDIARREGLSLSGAKSRVQRGRKMLKGMLLDCCRFEFDKHGNLIDYERQKRPECRTPKDVSPEVQAMNALIDQSPS